MPATISAKTARAVLGVARAAGLDPAELAQAHGLEAAMTDVDARLPWSGWLAAWEDVVRRGGRDGLAIAAAEALPFGHWDVIDYLLATSDNLGIALRRFERYFAIISTGVEHRMERDGGTVRITRHYAPDCQTRLLAPAEFAFAATVARMRILLGFRWSPRGIAFASPPPASDAEHRRFFGCPVHFEQPTSTIVIDAADLTLPMQKRDSGLGLVLERHAEHLVSGLDTDRDFVSHVRRVIVSGLPDADISIGRAAKQLGVSVRTLQRRLRESSLSFDGLCDQMRSELARRYLDDPALSIQETAHLLGFGEIRGFYRAFKRWQGTTPAEYRRRPKVDVGAPGP
jgi:AraC-like DNA-binding protein